MMGICVVLVVLLQLALCIWPGDSILLDTQGTGNILKPEYGLHYEKLGNLYQGIDRYYIMVAIKIPHQSRAEHTNKTRRLNCSMLKSPQGDYLSELPEWDTDRPEYHSEKIAWNDKIYHHHHWNEHRTRSLLPWYVCDTLLPLYQQLVEFENKYIKRAHDLLHEDLRDLFPPSRERQRRSFLGIATTIAGFALQGINAYTEYRKQKMMSTAISMMKTHQQELEKDLVSISNELGTVAMMTTHSIRRLDRAIKDTDIKIFNLESNIFKLQAQINGSHNIMKHNAHAIVLLTMLSGKLFSLYQRHLNQYQEIMIEIDKLIDALDMLETGHLSHKLITPKTLKKYLRRVQEEMLDKEYRVIIPELEHYYRMPLVTHSFESRNLLMVQIPVFVQKNDYHTMNLYRVTAVPVPYNLGEPPTGREEDRQYTLTQLDNRIVAFNVQGGATTMTEQELATCTVYNKMYFCESMMFRSFEDDLPCELAVVMNRDNTYIKDHCKFQYLYNHIPEPLILESDTQLLLAGIPTPWQIVCPQNRDPIPVPYEGHAYAVIEKQDVCECTVRAGNYVSMQRLTECDPQELYPSLKFPINIALMYTFDSHIDDWDFTILKQPWVYEVPDPMIVQEHDPDVMEAIPSDHVLELEKVAEMIHTNRQAYETKADKALSMNDVNTWFEEDNFGFGLTFIGFFVSIALVLVLTAVLGYTCVARAKLMGLNEKMAKVMSVYTMVANAKPAKAEIINLDIDHVILGWRVLGILVIYVALASAILAILYYVYRRINQACTRAMISPEGKSRDITHIHLEIQNSNISKTVCIYVGTRYGYPTYFHSYGSIRSHEMDLAQHWTYDILNVPWTSLDLRYKGQRVFMPTCVTVPLSKKYAIRAVMEDPQANTYRLLAVTEGMIHVIKRNMSVFDQIDDRGQLPPIPSLTNKMVPQSRLSPIPTMQDNAIYEEMNEAEIATTSTSRPQPDKVTVTKIEVPAGAIGTSSLGTLPRKPKERIHDEDLVVSL